MAVDNLFQCLDGRIHRAISTGAGFELLATDADAEAGYRLDTHTAGHLQVFQLDAVVLRAVGTGKQHDVIIVDVLLLVGQFEELFIHLVQFLLFEVDAESVQAVLQCGTS